MYDTQLSFLFPSNAGDAIEVLERCLEWLGTGYEQQAKTSFRQKREPLGLEINDAGVGLSVSYWGGCSLSAKGRS